MIDFDRPDDGDLTITAGMGMCDFCTPPAPSAWVYPCRTFVYPVQVELPNQRLMESIGDWGACEECAALIERRSKAKLAKRAGQSFDAGLQLPTVLAFFMYRKDEPRRPTEQPFVVFDEAIVIPD